MIPVNFFGGAHGNFLGHLLQLAFTNEDTVNSPILQFSSTWHASRKNKVFISENIAQCFHFWWEYAEPLKPQTINALRELKKQTTLVSISQNSLEEQALLRSMRFRVADLSMFTFNEIMSMNKAEFHNEWQRRFFFHHQTDSWQYKDAVTMFPTIERVVFDEYGKPNWQNLVKTLCVCDDATSSRQRIDFWINRLHMANKWVTDIKIHDIIEIKLIWLYNEADDFKIFDTICKIGDAFSLPVKASFNKITELLQFFRQNLKDVPNVELVSHKFNVASQGLPTEDLLLSGPDNAYLLNMLLLSNPTFSTDKYSFPQNTDELRKLIQLS
jgi:hypothetical protein